MFSIFYSWNKNAILHDVYTQVGKWKTARTRQFIAIF